MKITAITPLLFLASCASGPTLIVKPDGTKMINLGVSAMEDTEDETAVVKLADGSEIAYAKKGKKQTTVPQTITRWHYGSEMFGNAMKAARSVLNKAQSGKTDRALSADEVSKEALRQETAQKSIESQPATNVVE